jgi:hypothetical protein
MGRHNAFVVPLPADALSTALPSDYLALLSFSGAHEGIVEALVRLFPQSPYKVALLESALCPPLPQLLARAKEAGIPLIHLEPELPKAAQQAKNFPRPFSANIIAPGSAASGLIPRLARDPLSTHLSWVGYQTYLCAPSLLSSLQEHYFSCLRLGAYREDFSAAEPLLRAQTVSYIDLAALRHSDAPEVVEAGPNGLYAEEICQLARYIAMGGQPQACFVYGYPKNPDSLQIVSRLLAQILWHLFEGLALRRHEDPSRPEQKMLFTYKDVCFGGNKQNIRFLQSLQTARWWIEVPSTATESVFIPCSHQAYAQALKGEIPLIWLHYYQKISCK